MKYLKKMMAFLLIFAMLFVMGSCAAKDKDDDKDDDDKKTSQSSDKNDDKKDKDENNSSNEDSSNSNSVINDILNNNTSNNTGNNTTDNNQTAVTDPAQAIIGTWKWDYDMTSMMNEMLSSFSSELGGDLNVNATLALPFLFTFDGNGGMTMTMDTATFSTSIQTYMKAMVEAIYAQYETQGISRADADAQFQAEAGMTLDEYVQMFNADTLFGSDVTTTGTYKVNGDKLSVADSESVLSDDNYVTFSIVGNKLIITEEVGDGFDFSQLNATFPIEFTKQ